MEATNPSCAEVVKETKRSPVRNADGSPQEPEGFFGPPTAQEVSRLTFGKLRDIRIHAQELRNQFARLLNRGSSLE